MNYCPHVFWLLGRSTLLRHVKVYILIHQKAVHEKVGLRRGGVEYGYPIGIAA